MSIVPSERRSYTSENGDGFRIPRPYYYVPKSIQESMTGSVVDEPQIQQIPLAPMSPTNYTAQQQISSFFRFLQDDQEDTNATGNHKTLAPSTSRRGRPNHPLVSACFCALQLAIGFGLIAFGGLQSAELQKDLKNITDDYPPDKLRSVISAGSMAVTGLFLIAAGVVGAVAFLANQRGIKMGHVVIAGCAATFTLYGTIYSSYDLIDHEGYTSSDRAMYWSILVFASLGTLMALIATIIQASSTLAPQRGKFKQRPNKAYVTCSVVLLIVCSAAIACGSIGFEKAINAEETELKRILQLKRQLTLSALIVGVYVWCWALSALTAALLRSRALSLTLVVLCLPPVFILVEQIVAGYPELIARMVNGDMKTDLGLHLAVLSLCFLSEILYFVMLPIIGFFIFVD